MKNEWLKKRSAKEWGGLMVWLHTVWSCKTARTEVPGGEKLWVSRNNTHVCTIYRRSSGWTICFYKGHRKNYIDKELPRHGTTDFWEEIDQVLIISFQAKGISV